MTRTSTIFAKTFISLAALLAAPGAALAEKPDFAAATRPPYTPEGGKSINGKSIGEMKTKVQELWPTIVFEQDGKKIEYVATLDTDAGPIEIEFYPDVAPNHARSFIALCKVGFYDGLMFHRCIPDFVIQGGCPLGTGTGGPGYCVKPEFSARTHARGVLSMARAMPRDSAGSQFFICHGAPKFLDNNYTVFGRVTKGMDAVDAICVADRDDNDRPLKPVKIKSAKVAIKGE